MLSGRPALTNRLRREQLKDLLEYADIQIITVYVQVRPWVPFSTGLSANGRSRVQVEEDLLWKRICDRLKQEPERKKYNEDKYDWMRQTVDFYERARFDHLIYPDDSSPDLSLQKRDLWNYTVHNNDHGGSRLMTSLMAIVNDASHRASVRSELRSLPRYR